MIKIEETQYYATKFYQVTVIATDGKRSVPIGVISFKDGDCTFETIPSLSISTEVVKEVGREMDALKYQVKTGIRQKDGRLHNDS